MAQHKLGRVKATRNILPVEVKSFIECNTLVEARRLEFKIKRMKSRRYLEGLMKIADVAQLVEHILGRDEVTGSILVIGSKKNKMKN